jgi:hypothetical protein
MRKAGSGKASSDLEIPMAAAPGSFPLSTFHVCALTWIQFPLEAQCEGFGILEPFEFFAEGRFQSDEQDLVA